MALTIPRRYFLVSGPSAERKLYLTFDDGPHPVHTVRLLDVLKQHKLTATFFVIGQEAAKYPEVLKRIVTEGHALGHHSFYHRNPSLTSASALLEELNQTADIFKSILGEETRLFRPPQGKITSSKFWRLAKDGWSTVLWNVDPKDYRCRSAEELRQRLSPQSLRGGDVILLHDNFPWAAEVLTDIAQAAQVKSLEFRTVEELCC